MQYQAMLNGQSDSELIARGTLISYLIGITEEYLDPQTLHWLYKIAADPVPQEVKTE